MSCHVLSIDLQNDYDYTIKLFGRNQSGNSVSLTVSDFKHYFYIGVRKSTTFPRNVFDVKNELYKVYSSEIDNMILDIVPITTRGEFKKTESQIDGNKIINIKSIYGYYLDTDIDKYLNAYKVYVKRDAKMSTIEMMFDNVFNKRKHFKPLEFFETKVDWKTRSV